MRVSIGLAALLLTSVLLSCGSAQTFTDAQRKKCNAALLMIVDQYRESDVDTVCTVALRLREQMQETTRQQILGCGATVSTTTGAIVFVRTASKTIPCLSSIESVEILEYTPLTSPAL